MGRKIAALVDDWQSATCNYELAAQFFAFWSWIYVLLIWFKIPAFSSLWWLWVIIFSVIVTMLFLQKRRFDHRNGEIARLLSGR
jgi:hypothetical protein